MIDWRTAQGRLGLTADGIPGKNTYAALFKRLGPNAAPAVLTSLGIAAAVHFPRYGIADTPERLADFLAQTANETGGYTAFVENLNYRADRLVAIWPSHFTPAQAQAAVGNPREIASRAYGGRMGNAPYPSDDGYRFRGMGMLQLTGRGNYEATNKRLGIGLDTDPEMAAVPALSLLIACDFYQHNMVLAAIDVGDPTLARQRTNGGTIGLDHVNALRAQILPVLA
jgi:putative chitinase